MKLEQLLAKQQRIAAQIEAARVIQKRLQKLNAALMAHPEVLEKLSDAQIVEILSKAVQPAPARVQPAQPQPTSGVTQ